MNITTKEQFIDLCMNTDVPKDVWDTFDGMDFVIYLNEFRRIVERLELTSVKTYSWRLTAPRLYLHSINSILSFASSSSFILQKVDEMKTRIVRLSVKLDLAGISV